METKSFSTLAVVGAWLGHVHEDHGFVQIHKVFARLYPGITPRGVASKADDVREYLARTVPGLAEFGRLPVGNIKQVAALALERLGPTLPVLGPIAASQRDEG